MKNKHGSNVRITLGTVILFNILQHYSISITTLIVYFTHFSILLFSFHVHVQLLFAFLHQFSHTFPLASHYRSTTTLPFTFFFIFINNLTFIATGCEDELSVARYAPSPAILSSSFTPRSFPVARPRHRYIGG
jgi:hypothetical protein